MGGHYAYLNEKKQAVKEQIKLEEERFFATLANGIELFNEELKHTKEIFSGEVAFKLYDTYGFPLDLTADMLREKNLRVDEAKFDALMSEQRQIAKAAWKGSGDKNVRGDFKALLEKFGENKFSGYEELSRTSKVLALLNEDFAEVDELKADDIGWAMFDVTPFYAQSGGQTGDSGEVESIADVFDTQKFYGLNLSHLRLNRNLKIGDIVGLKVSEEREQIARHHSATHLLHAALRAVLGAHIAQAGSLVEADRLRFDFSHPKALSDEELAKIEEFVNNAVCKGCAAKTEIMDIDDAKNSGAIALFGEKYGSKVRVVSFGEISKELCGGIHVRNLSEIGPFFIVKESGVSAGVRRIEAVCSRAALNLALQNRAKLAEISAELKGIEPLRAIEKLKDEIRSLKDQIKHASSSHALAFLNVGDTKLCVASVESGDIKTMIDEFKNSHEKAAIMLMQVGTDGKISIAAGVKNAPIKAGEWVKLAAQILGGGGGGRDDFATAGGRDVLKIEEAIKEAISYAKGKI